MDRIFRSRDKIEKMDTKIDLSAASEAVGKILSGETPAPTTKERLIEVGMTDSDRLDEGERHIQCLAQMMKGVRDGNVSTDAFFYSMSTCTQLLYDVMSAQFVGYNGMGERVYDRGWRYR